MEKEQPDSMATVQIKPEYPPSEYSASEPPPAYRRPMSSAVQIARIAAFTIVASSFILGAFILASSYVSARAGCQQLEQLDAMLDKELALEGRAYGNDALVADEPLPIGSAHALHGAPPPPPSLQPPVEVEQKKPVAAAHTEDALKQAESKVNEDQLQKLDDDNKNENDENSNESESNSSESAEDEDELDAVRPMLRLPIQFDLDDLAGAFLANNNQKGRMNCVVERRREEMMEKRFPFNILGAFSAKPEPAERIAIICHGGDDKSAMPIFPEPAAQVFAFPLSGPSRLPIRPMPPAALQPPSPMHRAAPFPMPMPWDSSEEVNNGPREMRIHVQRIIAMPSPHNMPPPDSKITPFTRQEDGPFPAPDMPFNRPQEMPFPRRQDIPINRPQEMPFPRPDQEVIFPRPQEMPFPRHQEMPFPRPQEIPFPRPQEIPFGRPQEVPFPRPQEIPFVRRQENIAPFQRPQETLIAFPRQQAQETPYPERQDGQHGEQNEQSTVMHHFIPQPQQPEIEQPEKIQVESMGGPMSLPWGLTPETLRAIHRHAVEADRQQEEPEADQQQQIDNDMQEVKTIVNTLAAAAAAEADTDSQTSQEGSGQTRDSPNQNVPVHLDAPVLIQQEEPSEERPHYVQPRSVRSVDALLHREKRVKRCSCDCA